jgi:hypothetical protein
MSVQGWRRWTIRRGSSAHQFTQNSSLLAALMASSMRNLMGRRFGRLMVISLAGSHPTSRNALWLCRCDCGAEKIIASNALLARSGGLTKSCGCLRREIGLTKTLTHGQSRKGRWSPTYRAWADMHWRVKSPSPKSAPYYRDIGIVVCERWTSFENFYADMGPRPRRLTLDRINPFGNYEPANCRWATVSEQNRNKRRSTTNQEGTQA